MNYYFITGTSRGIGKALVELLLEDKNNYVYGFARNKNIEHKCYRHFNIDLSHPDKVSEFDFPNLEDASKLVLINNAGTLGQVKHLGILSSLDIIDGYSVNVIAPAVLMNNFIKTYKAQRIDKLVINITSGAAQSPYDGWSIYCSSKAAIDMLSQVGALEQDLITDGSNCKVLAVAPGVVQTQMQQEIRASNVSDFSRKDKFIKLYEDEQLYLPKDVAKALLEIINNPSIVEDVIHRLVL